MGGKGSGRSKRSSKPLSEVFAGLYCDVEDVEIKLMKKAEEIEGLYKDFNALKSKLNYPIKKHKKIERLRRKLRK